MRKIFKYSLLGLSGLVVLLVVAVAIFAMTFDPNRYKPEIERIAKEQTGRPLTLKGNLEVAVWSSLGAKVAGVSLSERGSEREFLSVDNAHASVALMPLIHGQVIVDRIRVSGLKAEIVKQKDGRFNFSDLLEAKAEKPAAEPKAEPKTTPKTAPASGKRPVAFDIAGIEIDRPAQSYSIAKLDAKLGGNAAGITGIDLKLSAPRVSIAKDKAQGEAVIADVKLKQGSNDIQAKLSLAGVEGSAKALVIPQFNLELDVAGPDLPMKRFKIPVAGSLRADLEKQTLNADLTSKFDETNLQAKLGLTKFTPPSYVFDVNIDKLNLDRYLPPEKKETAAAAQPGAPKTPPPPPGPPPHQTPAATPPPPPPPPALNP